MKTWFETVSRSSRVSYWLIVVGMLGSAAAFLVRFVPDDWIGPNREVWYGWLFFASLNLTTAGIAVLHRSKPTEESK